MLSSSHSFKSSDSGTGSCYGGSLELVFSLLAMIFLFVFGMKALSLTWGDVVGSERQRVRLDEEIIELKKELRAERERQQAVSMELEKERAAADSSLDSAMAMIFKLQSKMSVDRLEARQFRELAKEKQGYDKQVIEHLKWMITNAGDAQNAPVNHHIDAKISSSDISTKGDLLNSLKSSLDFDSRRI